MMINYGGGKSPQRFKQMYSKPGNPKTSDSLSPSAAPFAILFQFFLGDLHFEDNLQRQQQFSFRRKEKYVSRLKYYVCEFQHIFVCFNQAKTSFPSCF